MFKTRILEVPGVKKASNSNTVPGSGRNETFFAFEGFNQGKPKVYPNNQADEDYLETLGMELSAGRFFSTEFPGDNKTVVLNETLVQEVGWDDPLGKIVRMTDVVDEEFVEVPYTVIGVVKDFHYESLREKIRGFVIRYSQNGGRLSVKVSPENIPGTIRSIENIWNEMSPAYPFEYSFLDDTFDRLYSAEQRIGKIFLAFTLITIFVAWPLVFFAMRKWLQNFAYRIDMDVWIFVLSGVIALGIALLSVSMKAVKAATANPVQSLRYE